MTPLEEYDEAVAAVLEMLDRLRPKPLSRWRRFRLWLVG